MTVWAVGRATNKNKHNIIWPELYISRCYNSADSPFFYHQLIQPRKYTSNSWGSGNVKISEHKPTERSKTRNDTHVYINFLFSADAAIASHVCFADWGQLIYLVAFVIWKENRCKSVLLFLGISCRQWWGLNSTCFHHTSWKTVFGKASHTILSEWWCATYVKSFWQFKRNTLVTV